MIGIVVVAHTRRLADAAIALAAEMVEASTAPRILAAAGTADGGVGTDAAAVAAALTEADDGEGVVVLMDLGSSVLAAEMALEFIDPELADRVVLSPAPLVEGLVAAVVTAAGGANLAQVAGEARRGADGKADHLGDDGEQAALAAAPQRDQWARGAAAAPAGGMPLAAVLDLPHGLHARPAAAVVTALSPFDVVARARNVSTTSAWADARSVTGLAGLGLGPGDEIEVTFSGPEADRARAAVARLIEQRFGEPEAVQDEAVQREVPIIGPVHRLTQLDLSRYVPTSDEEARLSSAVDAVAAFWNAAAGGRFDAIVRAQQALLLDRHFLEPAYNAVAAGAPASAGVALAVGQSTLRFQRLPAYLRARAEDVRGLGKLLVRSLMGEPLVAPLPQEPFVLVAAELDAATALALDPELCGGVLTWMGSQQGHGALMCAELGIGMRTHYLPARDLSEGELVAL